MKRFPYLSANLLKTSLYVILIWTVATCSINPTHRGVPTSISSTQPPTVSVETELPFETLVQGYRLDAAQSTPTVILAIDSAARDALSSKVSLEHQAILNEVDLNKKIILAATWGVKPSGGFSITIRKLSIINSTLIVSVDLVENDPNLPKIDAATFPYHLVLVDRLALPTQGNLHYQLISNEVVLAEGELP